jgi:hypothetical protein
MAQFLVSAGPPQSHSLLEDILLNRKTGAAVQVCPTFQTHRSVRTGRP